ncbi:hypothetical protein [Actinoplanes sp. L3-i22]|uniref:hypothetical protein n=1 Tax=Actinoplanes sp. L3-i22 TaxID=2836373 RepID=UPI001C744406|nr:hypothetical protein [Actinoplanes sp. L3-i22]BCY10803.1 hypothetical protein L3i22_058910 [Actinoplanes sp. L3-i22]
MILRGVNVFPTQVEELILRVPGLAPHYQCVLDRPGRRDTGRTLANLIKLTIGVSVRVEVVPRPRWNDRSARPAASSTTGRARLSPGACARDRSPR